MSPSCNRWVWGALTGGPSALGTTPEFWINLQSRYELEMARYEAGERIEEEVKPRVYA